MSALSSAQQSEVKAWEEEILACEHTLTLEQDLTSFPGYSKLPRCLIPFCLAYADNQSRRSVTSANSITTFGCAWFAAMSIAVDNNLAVSEGMGTPWSTLRRLATASVSSWVPSHQRAEEVSVRIRLWGLAERA